MANQPVITRRVALLGAAASSVALAVPATARTTEYELPVDAQLTLLANQFFEDAKRIDPSIRGAWFGVDQDERPGSFTSVTFVRGKSEAYDRAIRAKKARNS